MITSQWQSDFNRAQAVPWLVINSRRYDRIRYGDEQNCITKLECEDCKVSPASFHLLGCALEECPRCQGQIISCHCRCSFIKPAEPSNFRRQIGFIVISITSGLFVVSLLLLPSMTDAPPMYYVKGRATAAFAFITYAYLQVTAFDLHWRKKERKRARVYFYLLALFPLWCFPVLWIIMRALYLFAKHAYFSAALNGM